MLKFMRQIEDRLWQLGWIVEYRHRLLPDGTTYWIVECRRGKHRIVSKGQGKGRVLREAYRLTCELDGEG